MSDIDLLFEQANTFGLVAPKILSSPLYSPSEVDELIETKRADHAQGHLVELFSRWQLTFSMAFNRYTENGYVFFCEAKGFGYGWAERGYITPHTYGLNLAEVFYHLLKYRNFMGEHPTTRNAPYPWATLGNKVCAARTAIGMGDYFAKFARADIQLVLERFDIEPEKKEEILCLSGIHQDDLSLLLAGETADLSHEALWHTVKPLPSDLIDFADCVAPSRS